MKLLQVVAENQNQLWQNEQKSACILLAFFLQKSSI